MLLEGFNFNDMRKVQTSLDKVYFFLEPNWKK